MGVGAGVGEGGGGGWTYRDETVEILDGPPGHFAGEMTAGGRSGSPCRAFPPSPRRPSPVRVLPARVCCVHGNRLLSVRPALATAAIRGDTIKLLLKKREKKMFSLKHARSNNNGDVDDDHGRGNNESMTGCGLYTHAHMRINI